MLRWVGRLSPGMLLSAAMALLAVAPVSAASFGFDVEFDGNGTGDFGTLDVDEMGGDLVFTITLGADLGPNADLQSFYFNLVDPFSGLEIVADDAPNTPYSLMSPLFPVASVQGGAGSSFDNGVEFGNGGGAKGNFTLQSATFTLSADQSLALADLLETSSTNNAGLVNFAAHVQSTEAFPGDDSETVGGQVPEPSTALLLASGLVAMAMGRGGARVTPISGRRRTPRGVCAGTCPGEPACADGRRRRRTGHRDPAPGSPGGTRRG